MEIVTAENDSSSCSDCNGNYLYLFSYIFSLVGRPVVRGRFIGNQSRWMVSLLFLLRCASVNTPELWVKAKKLVYKLLHNTDMGHRESVVQKHLPKPKATELEWHANRNQTWLACWLGQLYSPSSATFYWMKCGCNRQRDARWGGEVTRTVERTLTACRAT